ncbi:MAG: TetR/AcrR family transcriptional regulator [Flavobacteriales bacterium]|nr:TetR/AcrR family transcriptional regulator [Flavobacteriales bacterium]
MEQKEKQFVSKALDVFMSYGIKAVTMDDMARHLGISKKTIYNYVKDKNDLVKKSLMCQCLSEAEYISGICTQGLNAIDEMFEISKFISGMLKGVHPSIHYDLEKYHAEAFKEVMNLHEQNIYKIMSSNLKKGIDEGLYREDLNIDVITKIYMKKIDILFDAEVFPPNEIGFDQVYAIMFRYHILGVASPKGAEYVQKKFNEIKQATI